MPLTGGNTLKVLFITQHYLDNTANSNCLKNLISVLEQDISVEIASIGRKKHLFRSDGIQVHTVDKGFAKRCVNGIISTRIFTFFFNVIKRMSSRWFYLLDFVCRYATANHSIIKQINDIINAGEIDCIISMCVPFYCHYIASRVKKKSPHLKWIAYYYDPYSFNALGRLNFEGMLSVEERVLKYADSIILTKKMYEEFSTCVLKKHLCKAIVCEFPNVKKRAVTERNHTIEFDPNKINCVFTGYLYPDIRNPKYFLELLSRCNTDIVFYIVGGVYIVGGSNELKEELNLEYYQRNLDIRLNIIETVPIEEAFKIMNDADILVNIGNSIPNQLPSKIFDYISMGKPIVNICKLEDCLSLEHTAKYPLCLDLFETKDMTEETVKNFEAFCQESKGKKMQFYDIEKLFFTSTPQYVADQIKELLEK